MNGWSEIGDKHETTASVFINADQMLPHVYLENQLVYKSMDYQRGWIAFYSMSDSDARYFNLYLDIWSV